MIPDNLFQEKTKPCKVALSLKHTHFLLTQNKLQAILTFNLIFKDFKKRVEIEATNIPEQDVFVMLSFIRQL